MSKAGFAIFTWALVTGMAMAESSLSATQAIGMSFLVYAGSAQLAALPLIAGDFPLWTIFVTAIIVNLRFIIFSAGIQPYFKNRSFWKRSVLGYLNGDLNFALFMSKVPKIPKRPISFTVFLGHVFDQLVRLANRVFGGDFPCRSSPRLLGIGLCWNLGVNSYFVTDA